VKGLFCYHSQSGNTLLVCRFLSKKMDFISWDFFDIATGSPQEIQPYDVIGFATWTYFLRLPPFFEQFLYNLPVQKGKHAFLLSTFGVMPGQVLIKMNKILTAKGFAVMDGYSLHTPESYPPYILKGWDNREAPTPHELIEFESFTIRLTDHLQKIQAGQALKPGKIKLDIFSRLIPPPSLQKVRLEMGTLAVDAALCDQCSICKQVCLYEAIDHNMPPVFIPEKCQGCWACFNHCPQQAIFTDKIRGEGHYRSPAEVLTAKLGG
jgi:NAD-dependent dihydropyrimidine dehydrogenase PreA subunit